MGAIVIPLAGPYLYPFRLLVDVWGFRHLVLPYQSGGCRSGQGPGGVCGSRVQVEGVFLILQDRCLEQPRHHRRQREGRKAQAVKVIQEKNEKERKKRSCSPS